MGIPIREPQVEEISFVSTNYPIFMDAAADTLVWSVPEGTPHAADGKVRFESGLSRFAVASSVEVWRFPKLEREQKHEIAMFIDRESGGVISLEVMLHPTKSGQRPAVSILRGMLGGQPATYAGFTFPRHRPPARTVTFGEEDETVTVHFDRGGQPSRIWRGDVSTRATGHMLHIAPDVWALVWRTTRSAGITLCDEREGTVSGTTVSVGEERTLSFGIRSAIRWSADLA
jgi:hypothetical protein